jgi:hypothetical protein
VSTSEHVAAIDRSGDLGAGLLLTQTFRNCVQNPRCPVFTRAHGVCARSDEQVQRSARPYYGIACFGSGRFEGLAIDFRSGVPPEVQWWAAGIPLLWEGNVVSPQEMACEVADHSHLWRLNAAGPNHTPDDVHRYEGLATIFRSHIHSRADEANRALWAKADSMGLERQSGYLHNIIAVRQHKSLIMIVSTGALERLGELARDVAGATHAIVLDNGGSCQVAVRRPGVRQPLIPLIQGPYFREPTLALAVFELDCDDPKGAFFSPNHQLLPNKSRSLRT